MTSLNESQKRSILSSFLDIHRRMAEFEAMLAQGDRPSPFSQYVNDLSPTESKVVQDYFARLRAAMLDCLRESDIALEVGRTSARWALQCGMIFLDIAVSEFSPDRLRGYGPVDPSAAAEVVKVQQTVRRLVERVAAYLRQGAGQDLPQRLARLEASRGDVGTLTLLEKVITRWGLVEFRPQLDLIVRRLEAPEFEIAVFGRVSSGKSSLLNHVVGGDVLPVGVTPITAVPTRLVRGDRPAALISFAEEAARTVPVEELRLYASEEGNPGNRKHVTGILVQLPASRLRDGIVLVDTPGIGSLARSGSAETFAYLPRCDLGVVLIDAASTLTPDDLDVLRLLYEAGIPAHVLLSKADLLTSADRQRTVDYVRKRVQQELSLELPVHPVSTVGADEELLTRWFEHDIEPLLARHRALTESSLRRKIASLRDSVLAVLQVLHARHGGGTAHDRASVDPGLVRRILDEANVAIREADRRCRDWNTDAQSLLEVVLQDAAQGVAALPVGPADTAETPVVAALRRLLTQRGQMALELATSLRKTLIRTLKSLGKAAPLTQIDAAPLRDAVPRGLPPVDLLPVGETLRWPRPWWASLLPSLAVWALRRAIERHLGPTLREQIQLYDRQLQVWLRACLGQFVELYEAQAEVCREQVRRLTGDGAVADSTPELDELRATVEELQQAGSHGAQAARGLVNAGTGQGQE
jgi:GTP-binding protein EngB required for normal cell division